MPTGKLTPGLERLAYVDRLTRAQSAALSRFGDLLIGEKYVRRPAPRRRALPTPSDNGIQRINTMSVLFNGSVYHAADASNSAANAALERVGNTISTVVITVSGQPAIVYEGVVYIKEHVIANGPDWEASNIHGVNIGDLLASGDIPPDGIDSDAPADAWERYGG